MVKEKSSRTKSLASSSNNQERKKFSKTQESERKEAWMRVPIFIVSGIILEVWGFFVFCFAVAQLILVLIDKKKNKELLDMCKVYLIQLYGFVKYVTFLTNERPFPFGNLKKSVNEKE